MSTSLEQDVDFFIVSDPGFTDDEAYAFLAGIGLNTSTLPPMTAAVNEGHTGAMIALVPSDADLKRIAFKGGEAKDQLHLTLLFLGEAKDVSEKAREQITNIARRYAREPIKANAFSVNVFNPNGDEPCVVLGVGNGDDSLENVRSNIASAVRGMSGYSLVEQHTPWVPHVTLAYTDDLDVLKTMVSRVGPITFDKIRIAFAGEVTDIPLDEPLTAHASHDQSTHGNWARTKGMTKVQKPFTKTELSAHVTRVKEGIAAAFKQGLDTKFTHQSATGVWTPERDAIHRQIVDDVYAKAASVPNQGRAIMSGGPAGAGKSTALGQLVNLDDYLLINPDSMKEELAKRGLIPEIPGFDDLSPMERSTLVHQESRRLAAMLSRRAQADKKNLIYDTTMTSYTGTKDQINELNDAGYDKISGIFVDVPYGVSIDRTRARYAQEANAYRQGKGQGGRFLPTSAINAHFDQSGRSYARSTFKSLKNMFDAYVSYDNSGSSPKLHDSSGDIV